MDHLCVRCFPPVLVSLCHGGRPEPVDPKKTSLQGVEEEMADKVEGCEGKGSAGGDECLMRRALAAHADYIYTQEAPSRGDDDTLLLHALECYRVHVNINLITTDPS
uniref:Phytosulfokine n=1 Tax=Musa acuminata TaxID=4641 RepID=Q1EPD2_MUSAC|nr:phytosulfokine family protein [Musa acuminata]